MCLNIRSNSSSDLLGILVNPRDNVQTIENFFDFSFLIKDKRVGQDLLQDGIPSYTIINVESLNEGLLPNERKQMVLSIGMRDLRLLAGLLSRDAEHSLHRDDALYSAANAHEQAKIITERQEKTLKARTKKRKSDHE
jgi:hypothetical protein